MNHEWMREYSPGQWKNHILKQSESTTSFIEKKKQLLRAEECNEYALDFSPQEHANVWFPIISKHSESCLVQISTTSKGRELPETIDVHSIAQWVIDLVFPEKEYKTPYINALPSLYLCNVPKSCDGTYWKIEGSSMGLALAVVIIAHWTGLTPERGLILSGSLASDPSSINSIDSPTEKEHVIEAEISLHTKEHPYSYVCRDQCPATDILNNCFGEQWKMALRDSLDTSPFSTLRFANLCYKKRDYSNAEKIIDKSDKQEGWAQSQVYKIKGQCLLYKGDPEAFTFICKAINHYKELQEEEKRLHFYEFIEIRCSLAIAYINRGQPSKAVSVMKTALEELEKIKIKWGRKWYTTFTRVAGTLRRSYQAIGDTQKAIQIQKEGIENATFANPNELCRLYIDLADSLHRDDDKQHEAKVAIQEAYLHFKKTDVDDRRMTRRFLEIQNKRILGYPETRSNKKLMILNWPHPLEFIQYTIIKGKDAFEKESADLVCSIREKKDNQLLLAILGELCRGAKHHQVFTPAQTAAKHLLNHQTFTLESDIINALNNILNKNIHPFIQLAAY